MITAGLDCGARSIKVVLMRDGLVAARRLAPGGDDQEAVATACLASALWDAGITRGQVTAIAATGAGRQSIPWATLELTDVTAAAMGAVSAHHAARTVLDVGAEEARALRCDASGGLLDFVLNEKCAAGTGAFIETMARALEIPLEQFGAISLRGEATATVNAQCAVFAESEVVSLLHARAPVPDIARAVNEAIAGRLAGLAARVGIEPDVLLAGGLARNHGLVKALSAALGVPVIVPEHPEFIGATGAALAAQAHQVRSR